MIAAIARGIQTLLPGAPQPKLRLSVAGHREGTETLVVWARVTNEGGAPITVDTVSCHVRAGRFSGPLIPLTFRSRPKPPFRLASHSSAQWERRIKIKEQWMRARNADCTVFISGGGVNLYKRSRIVQR
ncbi:hypothetical protein DMB37_34165 [Nocardia sp. CS682]|nr:hypothetical protein DMB37_34165 [Nocardia sp. CS682]